MVMRAPVSIAMGLVFNTAAHTEVGAFGTTLCERCIHDVGIADFPATAALLAYYIRPCIITSKVKQQVMSVHQRVPWDMGPI